MEKQFLTPKELFEENGLESPYNPKPITNNGSNRVLFWHVPAFIERNVDNKKLTELDIFDDEEGRNFRISRLGLIYDMDEEVFQALDEKVDNKKLWENEPRRDEVIKKAEQLIIRNKYNLGYTMGGLYLDFNALLNVLNGNTPISVAEKIIDNNLFLGNMETFYINAIFEGKTKKECDEAKKNYLKTLELIKNNPDVHFSLPQERRIDFKYVDYGQGVAMSFCEPSVSDAFGYGPQFLCDARISKKQELEYVQELESIDNNQDTTKNNKIKSEIRDIDNQMAKLELDSINELNKQLKLVPNRSL